METANCNSRKKTTLINTLKITIHVVQYLLPVSANLLCRCHIDLAISTADSRAYRPCSRDGGGPVGGRGGGEGVWTPQALTLLLWGKDVHKALEQR